MKKQFVILATLAGASPILKCDNEYKEQHHKKNKYSIEEVSKHDGNIYKRIWVSYKNDVYDITDFIDHHPGSRSKIMMAAGGAIDPFWKFWVLHTEKGPDKNIGLNILKRFLIGQLVPDDNDEKEEQIENIENETIEKEQQDNNDDDDDDENIWWNNEPHRGKVIPICEPGGKTEPFQGESPLLKNKFMSPNDEFFIRNHGPTPERCYPTLCVEVELPPSLTRTTEEPSPISSCCQTTTPPLPLPPTTTTLTNVSSLFQPVSFTKKTLKTMPIVRNLAVTLQCSGNRLGETWKALNDYNLYNKFGVNAWSGHGLISNATWSGVRMCDIFKQAGITKELLNKFDKEIDMIKKKKKNKKTILDNDEEEDDDEDDDTSWWVEMYGSEGYSNVIPLSLALDPTRDVLIAFEMNGESLPRDHGNPLRVIVPGVVGAKSVKWVNRIVVKKLKQCESPWFNKIYRDPPPFHKNHILEWPVQSFIQSQVYVDNEQEKKENYIDNNVDNKSVGSKDVMITGFAYSGGGRNIKKVEISLDNGMTWPLEADLEVLREKNKGISQDMNKNMKYNWTWTKWTMRLTKEQQIELEKHVYEEKQKENIYICCRAKDSIGDVQPDTPREALLKHPSGYFFNPIHRVKFAPNNGEAAQQQVVIK